MAAQRQSLGSALLCVSYNEGNNAEMNDSHTPLPTCLNIPSLSVRKAPSFNRVTSLRSRITAADQALASSQLKAEATMFLHVYTHACTNTHAHKHTRAHMDIHVHTCAQIHICTGTQTQAHIYMQTQTSTHAYVHMCTHNGHLHTRVCSHIHIHTRSVMCAHA